VTLCAICTMHVARMNMGMVEPQNQSRWFVSGLVSKLAATVSSGLASKPVATISFDLATKPIALGFPVWASKPAATVW
jgi:hypothetical protein